MILSFTSSKGGVGKSTSCAAIGCALAAEGSKVLILDLDPNRTLASWYKKVPYPGIQVEHSDPDSFSDRMKQHLAGKAFDHILIDLAGFLHTAILRAFALADAVIVPAGASVPDLMEAVKTIRHVKGVSESIDRPITSRLLMTRLPTLQSNLGKYINEQIASMQIPCIDRGMTERVAYKEMFVTGRPPHDSDPKAAAEIAAIIKDIRAAVSGTAQDQRIKGAA